MYTGDRTQQGPLSIDRVRVLREYDLILVDDEPSGGNPSWNAACTSSTTNGAVDATLVKVGSVWEIKVSEQGHYNCTIDNIVGAGHDGYYHFEGLRGIGNAGQYIYVQGTKGTFSFKNNDDRKNTSDRTSDVLRIGGRQFKMVVVEDDTDIPTFAGAKTLVLPKRPIQRQI